VAGLLTAATGATAGVIAVAALLGWPGGGPGTAGLLAAGEGGVLIAAVVLVALAGAPGDGTGTVALLG